MQFPRLYPVTAHTDHVGPGSTFVAIKGTQYDGVTYISQAIERGATTIVVAQDTVIEQSVRDLISRAGVGLVFVENTRQALAQLSARSLGHPAKKLKILGVTGTKGKTTSVYLLEHLLRASGRTTALISTVHNYINGERVDGALTTPLPDYLHVFFDLCVTSGVEYVVMEVSAQSLVLHRLEDIFFEGIIFTNFDQEHAEFFATMDDYFHAKSLIFNHLRSSAPAILNGDDSSVQKIESGKKIGFSPTADYRIVQHAISSRGSRFVMAYNHQEVAFESSTLIGLFNVYNSVGCLALLIELGFSPPELAAGLATFVRVPGRLECYALPNGARCFIDYAHTPGSYQSVLSLLRSLTDQLIVVFGAGGNRDRTKRPQMGKIAAEIADVVIITTDNPRTEDPERIVQDIAAGIAPEYAHKIWYEPDRETAIKKAYVSSRSTSVIALLGKGPDEYQEVKGVKIPLSEKQILLRLS